MAGRLATTDGSTITSHTCDGGSRTWIDIVPHGTHPAGEMLPIWNKQIKRTEFVGDMRGLEAMGEIPQVPETYQFVHPVYPSMNEYQLAMGETTIGGRRELRSSEGIFSIEELQKVVMARTRTAREAILMMGSLAEEYGYVDTGECLTVIDPREAWFFEIFGPGNGIEGARTARPTTYPGTDAYARLRVASWGLEVHSSGNLRLGGHHEAPPI
jgi:dipeptidase